MQSHVLMHDNTTEDYVWLEAIVARVRPSLCDCSVSMKSAVRLKEFNGDPRVISPSGGCVYRITKTTITYKLSSQKFIIDKISLFSWCPSPLINASFPLVSYSYTSNHILIRNHTSSWKKWMPNSPFLSQIKPPKPLLHVHLNPPPFTFEHTPLFWHGLASHGNTKSSKFWVLIIFHFPNVGLCVLLTFLRTIGSLKSCQTCALETLVAIIRTFPAIFAWVAVTRQDWKQKWIRLRRK